MTLKELKERVDWAIENNRGELDVVCIPNGKVGVGGTSVTSVKQATQGFDWDHGRFIIYPETKLIEFQEDPADYIGFINYLRKETGMSKTLSLMALEKCKEDIVVIVSNWLRAHGKKTSSDDRPNSQRGDVNIG